MESAWLDLAQPGTTFTGAERVAIAERARADRLDRTGGEPPNATEAPIRMLAANPAHTSRAWVDGVVETLGAQAYVEIAGIVARIVALDTFTRLIGVDPISFPEPRSGRPSPVAIPSRARKGKAWIPMAGYPVPPFTLSIVPAEMAATNATEHALYMPSRQMEDPDIVIDGLHRTQIETVATTVSHRNECFY
jgi:hypothetical protein